MRGLPSGSVIKDKNGKFYMLYSRWPRADVAFLNDHGKPQWGFYGYDDSLRGLFAQRVTGKRIPANFDF